MAGAIAWQPITTAQGTQGYTAPDPNNPGQYLYYGPDQQVYRDSYPGEVQPGDVGKDKVGPLQQILASYPGSSAGGKVASSAPAAASGSGVSSLQPTYLSQLFPNGLPQATAATAAPSSEVTAPTAAAMPNVNAPRAATQTAATALNSGGPSTSAITDSITAAMQPQFAQQDQAETEALANAGIVGGSTTGAMGALGNQQQQQLISAIAPYIMQGYDLSQTDMLANQSALNAGNQFNASALNSGAQFNAGNENTDLLANQSAGNQVNEFNAGNANTDALANQASTNQVNEFNAGAQNANSQFNISDLIKGGMYDSGLEAQQADTLAGYQNQDYLAQLGLQGNLIDAGAGATASSYQPIYQQAAAPNYSGFASALAPVATAGSSSGTSAATPQSSPMMWA